MARKPTAVVSLRLGDLIVEVDARGNPRGRVMQRDLGRYYALLRTALSTVSLSPEEATLVAEACSGMVFDEHSYRLLWAVVADAAQKRAAGGVADPAGLVARLRALTPCQALAVVDALERAEVLSNGEQRTSAELLRRAGLAN